MQPSFAPSRRIPLLACGIIALAAIAAYRSSFSGALVLDDIQSIVDNPTIRHLWPLSIPLSPPRVDLTVSARPLLNLSLAGNYAISGLHVWSYHAVNLAIHVAAALTLFGIIRRTRWSTLRAGRSLGEGPSPTRLSTGGAAQRVGVNALHPWFAFALALLWAVHPLQTESVTYVIQRAESLMGLFYLLALYGFVRYAEASVSAKAPPDKSADQLPGRKAWAALAVLACFLGMTTKEDMVSAPVLVLLYDRTFVSGSFREAWRRHRPVLLALAAAWIPLGVLFLLSGGNRGGSVGFGLGIRWWDYALTQFPAIVDYLRLSLWPHPLIFDYGAAWVRAASSVAGDLALVAVLVVGTAWALWRRPVLGFLGAWFFCILAPTSLMPGTSQMIVEHRMYLPLAAVLALAVGLVHATATWIGRALGSARTGTAIFCVILAGWAAGLVILTVRRNEAYRTPVALWRDNLAKRPDSPRAYANLGTVLIADGQAAAGLGYLQEAIRRDPTNVEAIKNEGNALATLGRRPEAVAAYERALQLKPDYAAVHDDLGILLAEHGQVREAIPHFEAALRADPRLAPAHFALGNALVRTGRVPEAIPHFQAAIALKADYAEAENNLATAFLRLDRPADAVAPLREAVRLRPDFADAHYNLGNTYARLSELPEAEKEFKQALQIQPRFADAENNLGSVLVQESRIPEATAHFEAALRIDPHSAEAQDALDRLHGAAP